MMGSQAGASNDRPVVAVYAAGPARRAVPGTVRDASIECPVRSLPSDPRVPTDPLAIDVHTEVDLWVRHLAPHGDVVDAGAALAQALRARRTRRNGVVRRALRAARVGGAVFAVVGDVDGRGHRLLAPAAVAALLEAVPGRLLFERRALGGERAPAHAVVAGPPGARTVLPAAVLRGETLRRGAAALPALAAGRAAARRRRGRGVAACAALTSCATAVPACARGTAAGCRGCAARARGAAHGRDVDGRRGRRAPGQVFVCPPRQGTPRDHHEPPHDCAHGRSRYAARCGRQREAAWPT